MTQIFACVQKWMSPGVDPTRRQHDKTNLSCKTNALKDTKNTSTVRRVCESEKATYKTFKEYKP